MPTLVRRIVRHTLIVKAIGVAWIALVIGGTQVLLRQLPSHQEELKDWVAAELGLKLEFEHLDAGWSWRGPELAFHEASVMAVDDTTPFLRARAASVGFNPLRLFWQLVTGSEVGVDRLTFEGTELTLVKTESGGYRLQGAPGPAARLQVRVPPDVDLLVRDSSVKYVDAAQSLTLDFRGVAGSMRRDGDLLALEASAEPPAEFAQRIQVSVQAVIADDSADASGEFTGDWRLSSEIDSVDLAAAAKLFPATPVAPAAGHGDVAAWLEWRDGALVGGRVNLELAEVSLTSADGTRPVIYDKVGLKGDWQRNNDTWEIALRDLAVTREGRVWPANTRADVEVERDASGLRHLAVRGSFARLEDLTPLLRPLPDSAWRQRWLALAPTGDLRNIDFALSRDSGGEHFDYTAEGEFAGLKAEPYDGLPGFDQLSGELRADSRSGRLELDTHQASFSWPTVFRQTFDLPTVRGILVWRAGQDAIRVVSDDLTIETPDATLRSNLELALPMDGGSPELDLRTEVSSFDVAAARRYLPIHKMPSTVVDWLDDALRGGRVESGEVTFAGPLRAFPFDGGEGQFKATLNVDAGQLAFVSDWPIAEELHGTVEFANAGFVARGSGRVLGNRTSEVVVEIPDLRTGELSLKTATIGPLADVLAFLNAAPLISSYLGEDFARLESPSGTGEVALDLELPLRDRDAYKITAGLNVTDGELAYRGLTPHATEIQGTLELADGVLHGQGMHAIFLDGPVTASVGSSSEPGYRARIDLEGEVAIDAVVSAFNLPYGDLLAGQTGWRGSFLIPAAAGAGSLPARITVDSNLSGVAIRFPEPFAKPPGEPTNLQVEIAFPEGRMQMQGYLGATRRFALDFDAPRSDEGRFEFERAALRFGGALPEFRADHGVTLDGTLPLLRVDDWLGLSRSSSGARSQWSGALAGVDLDVADLSVFGQRLGSTKLVARRRTDDWQFEIGSDAIAGTVLVPMDLNRDPKVVAVMRRLYLAAGDDETGGEGAHIDPRELPGLQLHADEFGVGQHQLGRMDAEIVSDPLGLRLVSFESATDAFKAEGSGGWFVGTSGDTTRLAVTLSSTDVGKMLQQLGLTAFVEAKTAEVTASVYWPGGPSGSWLDHLNGDLALRTETGSLIDVEPGGAGRAMGLLSISALPRRLALDFRDVFNRGLVFDEITADFVIDDGNAYTDNLKLTGPVAEVGVIGRTGLRDHDYSQQAVITAEPGKMLPTVGALIGGPAVAAALLIFTRIFKKPLGGIGRASYCVTGSWQEPMVERLTPEQLDQGALCAELPPNWARTRPAEVASR